VIIGKSKYVEPPSGYDRLDGQIEWYDNRSRRAQQLYKISKFSVILAAAAIPILSVKGHSLFVALLGALIAVVEAMQHLNQWQHNWITYRSTCEALRHEKYTYLERANPYDAISDADARRLLVERTESLISTEHSKWIAAQDDAAKNKLPEHPRNARAPN
jgi:hypothetical protein